MPITIRDIAKIAGVSHSTVSRSLNDSPLISEEQKRKIKELAHELGFEFNASARGLSRGKTGSIALIFPEYFERFSINLFFSSLQSHIRNVFEREGIDVVVAFPKNRFTGESSIQKLVSRRKVDGVLIINNEVDGLDVKLMKAAGVPYVFVHKHPSDMMECDADYFCTDHFAGGYMAGNRLISAGKKNLMCVAAIGEEFDARTDGFTAALKDSGISFDRNSILYGDCTFEYGVKTAAEKIIPAGNIDGVFCQTDFMALGVVQGLVRNGIKVPEQVSVIGYDDIELDSFFSPALTTVHQPSKEIAALASERLIEQLKGKRRKKPEHKIVTPSLVIRDT